MYEWCYSYNRYVILSSTISNLWTFHVSKMLVRMFCESNSIYIQIRLMNDYIDDSKRWKSLTSYPN